MSRYKLIMLCVFVCTIFLLSCKKSESPKIAQVQSQSQVKIDQEESEKKDLEYLLKELRKTNPFRPDHASGLIIETGGGTDLKGVIWDARKPFALIGDQVVGVGDSVDGKKVRTINKDSVVLEKDGEEEVLRLEVISE